MRLSETLSEKRIQLNLQGTSKNEVIAELARLAAADGSIRNVERFMERVLEREELYSTGLAEGIAIPHAQDAEIAGVITCVGVCPDGIDFDATDGKPVQVIFLIAANAQCDASYLNLLSQIVLLLGDEQVRSQVLTAQSPRQVIQIIVRAEENLSVHHRCE